MVFAILISIIGLGISARYNRKTYEYTVKHDKLTNAPLLNYIMNAHVDNWYSLDVVNSGYGPAIIKSLNYYHSEEEFNKIDHLFTKYYPLIRARIIRGKSHSKLIMNDSYIAPSGTMDLLDFHFVEETNMTIFYNFFKRCKGQNHI